MRGLGRQRYSCQFLRPIQRNDVNVEIVSKSDSSQWYSDDRHLWLGEFDQSEDFPVISDVHSPHPFDWTKWWFTIHIDFYRSVLLLIVRWEGTFSQLRICFNICGKSECSELRFIRVSSNVFHTRSDTVQQIGPSVNITFQIGGQHQWPSLFQFMLLKMMKDQHLFAVLSETSCIIQ